MENIFNLSVTQLLQEIEGNPQYIKAYIALSRAYQKEKNYQDAISILEAAGDMGLEGYEMEIQRELDIIYMLRGDYEISQEKSITHFASFQSSGGASYENKISDINIGRIINATEESVLLDRKQNLDFNEYARSKNIGGSKRLSVKMIRTPFFRKMHPNEIDYILLMPVGMAQVTGYLRNQGFNIDQDDLHIKIHRDRDFFNTGTGSDIFEDAKRVAGYAEGIDDPIIEEIMIKTETKTKLAGYSIIMLSIPSEPESQSAVLFAIAFSAYLKKKYNPFIIVGGFDLVSYPKLAQNSSKIDIAVQGPGENIAYNILTAIQYGLEIKDLPFTEFFDNGKLLAGKRTPWPVRPDYSGLPIDLYAYNVRRTLPENDQEIVKTLKDFNESRIIVSALKLTQGCPYGCIFCFSSLAPLSGIVSVATAVSYFSEMKNKHGIDNFIFMDDTLNFSKTYLNELCDAIIKSGLDIRWMDCARAEGLDPYLLEKMRRAGCVRLVFGMETGSPRISSYINKRLSLEQLEYTVKLADEAGIWVGLEVIIGFPYENKDDIQMTVDFLKKNKNKVNQIYYNMFSLREGTILHKYPEKYGICNVRDVYKTNLPRTEMINSLTRFAYDEINGLNWEEKLKQMISSFDYVLRETGDYDTFPYYEIEHFLFFLYRKYKDKKKICSIYDETTAYLCSHNTSWT